MVRLVRPTLVILCFSCVPGLSIAQDWPGWRGERSNGVGVVSRAPERWSPTENVVWRAEIEGSGISSPVVVGQRVYVTTATPYSLSARRRKFCTLRYPDARVLQEETTTDGAGFQSPSNRRASDRPRAGRCLIRAPRRHGPCVRDVHGHGAAHIGCPAPYH